MMSLENRLPLLKALQFGKGGEEVPDGVELSCVHPVPVAVIADSFRIKDNLREAYLVGQSVVSFTDDLMGQAKQDVLNTHSFASQVANHDVPDNNRQFDAWLNRFQEVMELVGYDTQPSLFQNHVVDSPTFTVGTLVLDQFNAIATEGSREAMKSALEGLRLVQTCPSSAISPATACLQFIPCQVARNGNIELPICSLNLTVNRAEYNLLGYGPRLDAATAGVQTANVKYVFNEEKYAGVRKEVIRILADMGEPVIGDLKI